MTEIEKNAFKQRIEDATALELTIINFELLIEFMDAAINADPKSPALTQSLEKSRECLATLYETLDMDIEFSHDLANIYMFINSVLIRANFAREKDEKNNELKQVRQMAAELKSAWQALADDPNLIAKLEAEESAPIYAGLTYGADGKLTEFEDFDPESGYKI